MYERGHACEECVYVGQRTVSLAVLSFYRVFETMSLVSTVAPRILCCLACKSVVSSVSASFHCRVLGFRCVPPNPAFFSFLKAIYLFIWCQTPPPPPPGHPGIHFVGLGSGWLLGSDLPVSVSWLLRLKVCTGYLFYNTWQVKCSPVRLDNHLSNNIQMKGI